MKFGHGSGLVASPSLPVKIVNVMSSTLSILHVQPTRRHLRRVVARSDRSGDEQASEGPLHALDGRIRVERRAVVERDALAQLDGPLGEVGVGVIDSARYGCTSRFVVDRGERLEERAGTHLAVRVALHVLRRPRVADLGLTGDGDRAARYGLQLGNRRRCRVCSGGRGRRGRRRGAACVVADRVGRCGRGGRCRRSGGGCRRRRGGLCRTTYVSFLSLQAAAISAARCQQPRSPRSGDDEPVVCSPLGVPLLIVASDPVAVLWRPVTTATGVFGTVSVVSQRCQHVPS